MQMKQGTLVLIIFLVVAVAFGGIWIGNTQLAAKGGTNVQQAETVAIASGCNLQPSLDASAKSFYNKGTSLSPDYNFWKDGDYDGIVTLAESLANKDQYELLANVSGYYNAKVSGTITCADTPKKEKVEMYEQGSLSTTFFNDDDQPNTAQALGVDETKTVQVKLVAANDKCFGNPQSDAKIIAVFDYNTSQYDDVEVADAKKVSVPQFYTGTGDRAYELNIGSLCDLAEMRMKITIEADAIVNPTDDITMYVMDTELVIQPKTSALESGVEDSEGTAIGQSDVSVTLDMS